MPALPPLCGDHNLSHCDLQRTGQGMGNDESGIPLAALQMVDHRTAHAREFSQPGLRHASFNAGILQCLHHRARELL